MRKSIAKILTAVTIISILSGDTLPVFASDADGVAQESQSATEFHFEEEVTSFSDLGIMFRAWENFVAENPGSTEAEQDAFLVQFVEEGGLRGVRNARSVSDYIPGYNNLNSAEQKLLLKHPVQAVKVFDCANKTTDATIEYYGISGWQDNSDAFRHCCWNALMKKAMSASDAEAWATAHEADSSGVDKEMDLFNNSVGRSISVSNKSNAAIYEAVKEKVIDGSCRRIVDNQLVETNETGLIK